MPLNEGDVQRRRRGPALETALLEAAWAELAEHGYDVLTIDAVAVRAGTSRAVLYRRWPSKQDLVLAALRHEVGKDIVVAPDTGSLRGDVIGLLRRANEVRYRLATLAFTQLGGFYRQAGTNLAEVSTIIRGGRDDSLEQAIQRARDRGEIGLSPIPQRIAQLPVDLFRYELLVTLQPLADETIEEIVDTIFLPLLDRR